jgi:methylmalonyl-CoA/ethylmalonyl-CoA epimerase
MSIGAIGQIALTVRDLPEAVAFYKDGLGLKQIPIPAPNLAFFDCAGIRLMLSPPEKEFVPGGSVIYFKVTDIHAAVSNAKANGVSFTDEPHLIAKMPDHELWMAFCRDPSGNALGLMAEVR